MFQLRTTLAVTLFVVLVAGCGGGSGATGGGGGSGAATPAAASNAGGGSGSGSGSGAAASGAINLGSASKSLESLNNYQFRMQYSASGTAEFIGVSKGGTMTMEGGMIMKPEPQAAEVKISSTDPTASAEASVMQMRVIGDTTYVNMGGEQWIASQDASSASTMDSYRPENLLGSYAGVSDLKPVGEETKNGVATTHYQSTQDVGGLAGTFGLPDGTWTMDVWIAKDGGYPVAMQAMAVAKEGADTGKFTMTVDITSMDDPSYKIEAPTNVMSFGS